VSASSDKLISFTFQPSIEAQRINCRSQRQTALKLLVGCNSPNRTTMVFAQASHSLWHGEHSWSLAGRSALFYFPSCNCSAEPDRGGDHQVDEMVREHDRHKVLPQLLSDQ
jgi:hypothetical protein